MKSIQKSFNFVYKDYYYLESNEKLKHFEDKNMVTEVHEYAEILSDIPKKYLILTPHYAYLGDYRLGERVEISINLNLSGSKDHSLNLVSRLPKGLTFTNGKLQGTIEKVSGLEVIEFEIKINNLYYKKKYYIKTYYNRIFNKSFVYKDFIDIGYNSSYYEYRPNGIYYRNLKRKALKFSTPIEEAKKAARIIYEKANGKEIILFTSGGIDSQCMIQAFVFAKVPFKAVIMKDKSGVNYQDVSNNYQFFKENNILDNLEIFEVDFLDFITCYKYLDYAFSYRHNNPEYGLLLHLMDKYDGFYVFSGRPVYISHHPSGKKVIG